MPTTINDVPYEILSAILHEAVELNLQDAPRYSYGFNGRRSASPAHGIRLRAHKCPDTLRWITTEAIRQVNRTWHDWACRYSLKSLYLSRWRGSERWLESRTLADPGTEPSGIAVYRDPYCSLKKTSNLFEHSPLLASFVRRIWFDGYYGAETNVLIFNILRSCEALQYVTLPWTALRHGNAKDWSYVCGRNRCIESLELLAIDLKETQMNNPANQVDKKPLLHSSTLVNFSNLKRLKIYGSSNFMPMTDATLVQMARTATNLREIHITRTTTVTLKGVISLIDASKANLQLVDYSPLSEGGQHEDEAPGPLFLSRKAIKALFYNNNTTNINTNSSGSNKSSLGPRERTLLAMLPPTKCTTFFGDRFVD